MLLMHCWVTRKLDDSDIQIVFGNVYVRETRYEYNQLRSLSSVSASRRRITDYSGFMNGNFHFIL